MSNTPNLNRTDHTHRRPDSAEVRSRNLQRLTGSRFLAGVWEKRDPGNEVDRKLCKGGPRYHAKCWRTVTDRDGPSYQNWTRFTGSQFVIKRLTRRMRRKIATRWDTCIPRSKRQTSIEMLVKSSRRKPNLHMHVFLPCSKRQTSNGDVIHT